MAQHVGIIAIGDELTIGRWQDTNSSWLARLMTDLGWHVTSIMVLPDDEQGLVHAFRQADQTNDLVIISGGLGAYGG